MNLKFLNYEKNQESEETRKFEGIATISLFDNQIILSYVVQRARNGGLFIQPFSKSINGEWKKSHIIDSNYMNDQINTFIKKNLNNSYESKPPQNNYASKIAKDDSECPF